MRQGQPSFAAMDATATIAAVARAPSGHTDRLLANRPFQNGTSTTWYMVAPSAIVPMSPPPDSVADRLRRPLILRIWILV